MDKAEPLNPKLVEYAIYVRKSTNPNSWKQEQSIGDQITACIEYANREGLKLALRSDDFSDFETPKDITIRNTDPDEKNRSVFKEYNNLFIVKEQDSWWSWARLKWKNLIKWVKQGKIKWILTYSTSRLTRNMVDAGEIINLVNENKVCLQFTNFRFEDNATGKMMLGFLFVFDNYFSNNQSEVVGRWKREWVNRGKSQWDKKHGYQIIEWRYRKEEPYFGLMQMAFRKKIDDKSDDKTIAKRLNDNGMLTPTWSRINANGLHAKWVESFFYGIYQHWKNEVDLTEVDPWFEPMISKEDFLILMERHMDRSKAKTVKKKNDTNTQLDPIPEDIIKDYHGYKLTHNIPNIGKRIIPWYNKAKILNPNLTLAEYIKPSQIKYGVKNKQVSKADRVEVNYEAIDNELLKIFSKFKPNPEVYEKYTKHMQSEYKTKNEERQNRLKTLRLALSESENNEANYIHKNGFLQWGDATEKAVYEKERKRLWERVYGFKQEIELLESQWRWELVAFEMFIKTLSELAVRFKYANYVQKHLIVKYLVSNITVSKQKRIAIALKPWYELLEEVQTRDGETRTHDHTTPSRVF